ncbi:ATP-grasp domain-containing protein [Streptomyces olivochromogenes]|uniref:ATP-grasp domain-containing protein n=1 Tax=Streptomyces olivochromogenes TaxID=1963 RepID=UPI001F280F73|nr:ATP-grasp domain-containing protein [Streptomyces olivochromogenes]MCF3134618.1 ATP-grasp domain-containing protein [Streptomyces olivochromogenes]
MPQRPKLVLVGQLSTLPFVFEAAERAGVDLILVPRGDDTEESARRARAVVEVLPLDIDGDPEAALAALVERHGRGPFGGIMAGNEKVVPWVARAARRLGLPGLSEEAAAVVRDKRSMRRRLRDAGLGAPGFVELDRRDSWTSALTLQFPVVVKPANGFSSLGVIRVDDKDRLEREVARTWDLVETHLRQGDEPAGEVGILAEEYLDGPEISAESLVHRGRVRIGAISWKGELTGPYFEESTLRAPARLPAEILAAVEAEVIGAHHAFGITEGTTHTELRLVGGVRPVVLEMGARIGGGGFMHHIVHVGGGVDLAAEALRIHLGQEPDCWSREPEPDGRVAASYLVPVGSGGRIVRVHGLDEVEADPRVDYVVRTVGPGDVLRPYPDWSGYPAIVLSQHASDAEAVEFRDHLARTLHVEYEERN